MARDNARRRAMAALAAAALALAGCGGASEAEFLELKQRYGYEPTEPPSATLITSREVNGGGDIHAALVVTGSQQVIYDPSGSFIDPSTKRVGDLLYGVTPEILQKFALHNADYRHNAMLQKVPLSSDAAETLLDRARQQGGSWPGFCGANIADVLGDVGPFSRVRDTMWPSELSADFSQLEGVETRVVSDDDDFSQSTRSR